MKLERLQLRNFRNIESLDLSPSAGVNLFLGSNGQGKTSILESIGILSQMRSFRGSPSDQWLKSETQAGEIGGRLAYGESTIDQPGLTTELKVRFAEGERSAEINGKPYRSLTRYLSQRFGDLRLGFHAIIFNPADHEIVRGEPALRRGFLDRALSAESLEYLTYLKRYQKNLEQKNAVLRFGDRSQTPLLESFQEALISDGAWLVLRRLEWLKRVETPLKQKLQKIAPTQAPLSMRYVSKWLVLSDSFFGQSSLPSLQTLEQLLWKHLGILRESEWAAKHSLGGPHRDDWSFLLGSLPLQGHGSQGETRSTLLALKLAELEVFQEATGHRPVFLLDDFSSELDETRRRYLVEFLTQSGLQVFVTTTEETGMANFHEGSVTAFRVSQGKIVDHEHTKPRPEFRELFSG